MVIVKRIVGVLCILLGLTANAYAQFDATVNKTSVAEGRTVQLQLTLIDAKAKDDPQIEVLAQDFDILSKGKSSSFQFINGDSTRSVTWKYYLMPKRLGALNIPAISVKTNKGVQTTKTIAVTVVAGAAAPSLGQNPSVAKRQDIWLEATVSDPKPYVKQSVIYTLKVLRTINVQNAELVVPELEDAVFEQIGESTSTTQIRNGRRVNETTVTYVYTPLKAGEITIPSVRLTTQIASTSSRGVFGGFLNYEPALITGPTVEIHVQPAAIDGPNWLPLYNLHLEEQWSDDDAATVGEPLTRTITVVASGTGGEQLPALSGDFGPQFKVYAERPETSRALDNDGKKLVGRRKQVLSMIPLAAGQIKVPEIRFPWFNVVTGREEVAIMPARILTVAPAAVSSQSAFVVQPAEPAVSLPNVEGEMASDSAQAGSQSVESLISSRIQPILYFLAGVGCSGVLFAGVWFRQRRRATKQRPEESVSGSKAQVPEFRDLRKSLSTVASVKQLIGELGDFAHTRGCVPRNAALKTIAQYFAECSTSQSETVQRLFQQLDAHLYAGGDFDVRAWCEEMMTFLGTCSDRNSRQNEPDRVAEKLPPLNPKSL